MYAAHPSAALLLRLPTEAQGGSSRAPSAKVRRVREGRVCGAHWSYHLIQLFERQLELVLKDSNIQATSDVVKRCDSLPARDKGKVRERMRVGAERSANGGIRRIEMEAEWRERKGSEHKYDK
ncbi:hypothetical protein C8R47DRAFT_1072237 [Mycena vitilis]|nr:hypothetical protein C8R47DRAFT_1072237 [Mycena vitilis]